MVLGFMACFEVEQFWLLQVALGERNSGLWFTVGARESWEEIRRERDLKDLPCGDAWGHHPLGC